MQLSFSCPFSLLEVFYSISHTPTVSSSYLLEKSGRIDGRFFPCSGNYGCDVPFKWFFLIFGAIFVIQGILLCFQISIRYSEGRMKALLVLSYIPALAEIVLLILGTVWLYQSSRCNVSLILLAISLLHTSGQDAMLATAKIMIYVLWAVVVFGLIVKIWRWCLSASQEAKEEKDVV